VFWYRIIVPKVGPNERLPVLYLLHGANSGPIEIMERSDVVKLSSASHLITAIPDADFSYYTKRMLLAGVYAATLLYWLEDRSQDAAATWAFLDRRIADIARIPQLRARVEKQIKRTPSPADILRRVARGRSGRWAPPRSR